MKIAVLMSTYNGHNFLDKQLKSIAEQTLINDIKLYIRDDGSSDDTFEIIEKWKDRVDIVLIKGENVGPAKSFWSLLMDKSIQADYYAFCDQDDIWDEDKVERGLKSIMDIEGPALWCSNCRLIDRDDRVLKKMMMSENPELSISSQLVCGSIQGCAMLFNEKLRTYIITKSPLVFPMHDFVVITYCIACGSVFYDSVPSFSYRLHQNNVIAKEQKSVIKRNIDSLKRWFSNDRKYEVSKFARVLLKDNLDYLDKKTIEYILDITNCKRKWGLRWKIVRNPLTKTDNMNALRSFKIRVMLGII